MKYALSVIIPAYNEAENLPVLHQRLKAALQPIPGDHELIFVNDGSTDNTLPVIKDLGKKDEAVKFIDLSRNFGHQVAVTAGLHYASGNRVALMDADLQNPPEVLPQLFEKMNEGWDVVYAKRQDRKGDGFLKRLTAGFFYRILSALTPIKVPPDAGDFRMMDRKVVNALNEMPEPHKFLRGMVAWVGFRQSSMEYESDVRYGGKSGYTYRKMIGFAIDGLTGFSNLPLKVASIAGFVVSGISFLLVLYTLYARLILEDYEPGWASIMISILFLGGIQLICLGIIGEYLSRIFSNVRRRPQYFINETNIENDPPVPSNRAVD